MEDIKKFRFWCHKVLPLVYDDSLSYYEFLCKVMKTLNDVIDQQNEIKEIIENIPDFATEEYVQDAIAELENRIEEVYLKIEDGVTKDYVDDAIEALADDVADNYLSKTTGATKAYVNDLTDVLQAAITALDNDKVQKDTTSGKKAYTHNGSTETQTDIKSDGTAGAIVTYDSDGGFKVTKEPDENTDVANKKYVDDTISGTGQLPAPVASDVGKALTATGVGAYGWNAKPVVQSTTDNIVYGRRSNAETDIRYTDQVADYTLCFRDSSGRTKVGAPTDNAHAATKKYVDDAITAALQQAGIFWRYIVIKFTDATNWVVGEPTLMTWGLIKDVAQNGGTLQIDQGGQALFNCMYTAAYSTYIVVKVFNIGGSLQTITINADGTYQFNLDKKG